MGKDGQVWYWAKVSTEWKPGLLDPHSVRREIRIAAGDRREQSLKMLLSDNFYSFTHFIDYKRPLKLTHLRFGEILCRQTEMWKVRHKTVCVTEEDEPTTLDNRSDGHEGNMAGRRWWGQLQQFSESVPPLREDEVPLVILTNRHHLESIPGKLYSDTCFQPAEEDWFLRQVLPEPGAGKRKKQISWNRKWPFLLWLYITLKWIHSFPSTILIFSPFSAGRLKSKSFSISTSQHKLLRTLVLVHTK